MSKYCFRCGKEFNRIDNFKRHLRKSIICDAIYMDVDRKLIINCYDLLLKQFLNEQTKPQKYICEYCHVEFASRCNYYTHKLHRCGINKKIKLLEDKILELQNQNNITNNTTNSHNNINNSNNTTNNNNNNILNNNNITINNYGSETSIDEIPIDKWISMFSKEEKMLPDIVKAVHFDIPENRNIYLPTTKNSFMMVFQNGDWTYIDKKLFMQMLINDKIKLVDKVLDKSRLEFLQKHHDIKHTKIALQICQDYKDDNKNALKDIEMILLSNRNIMKSIYNDTKNQLKLI